jgi:hypothetical protein
MLCNTDFYAASKESNKKMFACIVNTDISSGRGKHWFALFMDFRTSTPILEYFNSSGKEVSIVERFLCDQRNHILVKHNVKVHVPNYEKMQLQHDTFSCGPFALCFILWRIEGKERQEIMKIGTNDAVHKIRQTGLFARNADPIT